MYFPSNMQAGPFTMLLEGPYNKVWEQWRFD